VSKKPRKQPQHERAYSAAAPYRGFTVDSRPLAAELAAERRARQRAEFEAWLSSTGENEQETATE
jgi:hypothetical protein